MEEWEDVAKMRIAESGPVSMRFICRLGRRDAYTVLCTVCLHAVLMGTSSDEVLELDSST